MTQARRFARRAALRTCRTNAPRRERRRLLAEALEGRALLAADWLVSDYWNGSRPADVNADGSVAPLDALLVINEINAFGSHAVMGPAATQPSGEGENPAASGGRIYRDTNNDGMISPIDALLVINELNGEGESPLMRYQISLVLPGTNTALPTVGGIPTISKGQDYDLVVRVKDDRAGGRGVFAGYLDVLYNSTLTRPKVSEIQHVVLDGNPTNGTFTLSFNGSPPTAPIQFDDFSLSPITIADDIQAKLAALSTVGSSGGVPNVEVTYDPLPATGGQPAVPLRWQVRFRGTLLDQNVAKLGIATNLNGGTLPPNASGHIVETAQGVVTDPIAFREAFRSRIIPGGVNPVVFYTNALNAGNLPNRIDDLGAFATGSSPFPGTFAAELVRARMTAVDATGATPMVFAPELTQLITPAHDTLLYDRSSPLTLMEINAGPSVSLNITELVEANPDTISVTEDSTTGITFNPITGVPTGLPPAGGQDRKLPGANAANLRITSVNGVSTPGSIITLPSGSTIRFAGNTALTNPTQAANTIRYIPAGNLSGNAAETFTYTISDTVNTDSALVTVNITPVNDAPTIAVQGGLTGKFTLEDTALIFSSANSNAITIADIDAGSANVQLTLTATNGLLTMGSTTGLAVTGNGTASVLVTGTVANINAGLSGLTFNPTPAFPFSSTTGAAAIAINVNDLGNTGGGSLQANANLPIEVRAVNDAPANTVPGLQTVDEGAVLTFSPVISVADPDAGTSNIVVTLEVLVAGSGVLNVNATPVAGLTIGGNGTATLTLTGAQSLINAKLTTLTFTPATTPSPFVGSTTVRVTTNDQGNTGFGAPTPLTDIDTVPIDVVATVRPRARADSRTFAEAVTPTASSYRVDVLTNDLGNMGFVPTLEEIISQPASGGTVVIFDNGTPGNKADDQIDFLPTNPNFFGQVTFSYGIWDTSANPKPSPLPANAIATVTINITNTNDNPIAVNDPSVSTNEDIAIDIPVLANDSDPDNGFSGASDPIDILTPVVLTNPTNGTVAPGPGGTLRYRPNDHYNGPDSFTYNVTDGKGGTSNTATVSITVNPVNDNPVAQNDTFNPTEDSPTPLVVAAPGLLANDSDVDNPVATPNAGLSVVILTQPTRGTLTPQPDGSFTYQPTTLHFDGTDSFTYQASDGQGGLSNVATVSLVYIKVNDAPVANNDLNFTMTEDTTLTVPAPGILANDTDVENDPLTVLLPVIVVTAPPGDPTLSGLVVNQNGGFTYDPPDDFTGVVEFQYRAQDQNMLSNLALVRITVLEFNDPPTAVNDPGVSTNEGTLVDINVLANDSDPETANTALTLIQPGTAGTQTPSHGSVSIVTVGGVQRFRYTPSGDYFGPDSFTYRNSDGQNNSNIATVSINVVEQNDAPVAVNDGPLLAIKNFVDQAVSVLGNDFDPDNNDGLSGNNDVLRVTLVNGVVGPVATLHGTVRIVGTGVGAQIVYTPNNNYVGPDSFTYTISDGRSVNPLTASATVTLDVVDFVPKSVGGSVFIDTDNDGIFDPGEQPIQGFGVQITGVDFQNNPVSLTDNTDVDGQFNFSGLRPPKAGTDYIVSQLPLPYITDGKDSPRDADDATSSPVNGLIFDNGNDSFRLRWGITDQLGDITTLRFGERGVNPAALDDSRGLMTDLLASSGSDGFVLMTDLSGNFLWSWTLPGWGNVSALNIQLDANLASATLSGTYRSGTPFSIRIHQDPHLNTAAEGYPPGANNPLGPRFRILGRDDDKYILRIDGSAAAFGLTLAAAQVPAEAGEGEGAYDREFAREADELFANEAWA